MENRNYWRRDRLKLRAFTEADVQMYVDKVNCPDGRDQLNHDYLKFPQSEQEIRKLFEETLREGGNSDKRTLVIEDIASGDYAGEIFVWHTDRKNGVFRYGIVIDEKFRGKGYGKDALIVVMDYYFNELNYQKCSPSVYSFNKSSQRFHEKFGFQEEGRLRNDYYARGTYHDSIYYGMLREEFNALYSHFPL